MITDISATGVVARVIASQSFPSGFMVTEWADDADPFDTPVVEIANASMDLNGSMYSFSTPSVTELTLNLVPGTEGERNMSVLLNNNRAAQGRVAARDEITIVAIYPDGETKTYSQGKMTAGVPATSPSQEGRKKSKSFSFAFGKLS